MSVHIKSSVLCIFVGLLAACGGGGGGGGEATPPPEPANNPPIISGSPTINSLQVGDDYSFTPMGSDPDGDTLTYSAENLPLWLTLDPDTGSISGQPELADLGVFENIQLSVSDGEESADLDAFQISVVNPKLSEDNFDPQGVLTPIDTGNPDTTAYTNDGLLEVNFGNTNQRFENSVLELEFDAEGNLLDLQGESDVPVNISDNITIANNTRARVGLLTGAQINADPNFGITLKDEFEYIAYYLNTSTQITIGDPNDPSITESITLNVPLSGEIVFISDPYDPFTYRFAAVPFVGEYGIGESSNGFIPFIPQEGFSELDSFEGDLLEKSKFTIGYKVFDFFEIEGTRVTRVPDLFDDIDWENPLDSSIQYKAGMNGNANFAFSILSVGIFDFSLASASATIDVGNVRQHSAMQMTIAPDVSWQPEWFPILPTTEIIGNWVIEGSGEFSATLSGSYESTIPEAQISGLMVLNNDAARFTAEIPDETFPLSLSMVFENDEAIALIETPNVDLNPVITDAVLGGFDAAAETAQQAANDAEEAYGNYQLAFNLDGLRGSLPTIADQAISGLNSIPQTAYDATYDSVLAAFRSTCRTILGVRVCASSFVDEVGRAQSAARTARNRANDNIAPYISRLNTLKERATEVEDGPAFRSALKSILLEAIDNRLLSFSYSFSQSVDLNYLFDTVTVTVSGGYSNTFIILDDASTSTFQTAANNVDDIEPTYTISINTQEFFDSLPTEEAIAEARQDVENNLTPLPVFSGAGYTASGLTLSTFIVLDGEQVPIGEVNPLDPLSLLTAIGDTIADQLLQ